MHVAVFTGGEYMTPQDAATYLENSPPVDCVIAADSGLETLEKYRRFFVDWEKFTPDFILGDMDSITDKTLLLKYSDKVYEFPVDKDFTDTELALEKAHNLLSRKKKRNSEDRITLIGGCGGFTDHFIGILDTFSSVNHADFWLCSSQIICLLKENESLSVYDVSLTDRISVARTSDLYYGGLIKSEGLEWEYDCFRKQGMPSISNRISREYFDSGKPVKFIVSTGKYLVIVPKNAVLRKETLRSLV